VGADGALRAFFAPRSVAVVGASHDPGKLGHVLLKNVLDQGFPGDVYPVNPAGGEILGLRVWPSLPRLPHAADLVLLSVPNRAVPAALHDAAARGCRAAVVLASGFGEMSGQGPALQRQLRARSPRLIGPNCMGIYHRPSRLNATYFWDLPRRDGNVAFVSQSGAYGGMLFRDLDRRGLGISTFVSIGNQVDVTHAEVCEYLCGDRQSEVVALFIEQVRDGPRLLQACRLLSRKKPVLAMVVGRTSAGRRAALSHTGSLAGDWETARSALRQAGVRVTRDTDEFLDTLCVLGAYPGGARKGGLGIVTVSGGPCVAAADAAEDMGVAVPELAAATQARLSGLIPEFGARRNPVDMTPQMTPSGMPDAVAAVAEDVGVGALLAINVGLDRPEFAEAFVRARAHRPVLGFVLDARDIASRFLEVGIPLFPSPERAARSAALLLRAPATSAPSTAAGHALDEARSKRVLSALGVPLCREMLVASADAAARAAKRLGYPVALKALGAGAHKAVHGGVVLDVPDETPLRRAFSHLGRRFGPRMLVQEMIRGEHELLLGARRDPTFGVVTIFGAGGHLAEELRDVATHVGGLGPRDALSLIARTRAGRRLPRASVPLLARLLARIARWMSRNKTVQELDLNPVIVGAKTACVDALVVLRSRAPRR
jgi:acetate---CoA ligase (ADP-forming)